MRPALMSIEKLIFINKIDRPAASDERGLKAISERLTTAVVPMRAARGLGTRAACFTLSGGDDPESLSRVAKALAERATTGSWRRTSRTSLVSLISSFARSSRLRRSGHEPIVRVSIETPVETVDAVLASVARLGGVLEPLSLLGGLPTIETVMPLARAHDLQRQLPALTGGEGVLESDFGGYQPVSGTPPIRRRRTANPLNREEYMMHLARRVSCR